MNTSASDFATILRAATSSPRPDAAALVTALQQAEIAARRSRSLIQFDDLVGEWRLCFATGAKKSKQGVILGKGYYVPKLALALIAFTRDDRSSITGTATNQLKVGGLRLKFTGPCRYPGKKNLLIFDFTEMQISLFGRTIYQGKIRGGKHDAPKFTELSIAKLPFFAFFWASPDRIAARGRGGGLALWVRQELINNNNHLEAD
jgi:hypothetical protein